MPPCLIRPRDHTTGPAPSPTALFFTGASASSDLSCACRGQSCTALSAASFSIPGLTPCQSAVAVACVQGTFVLASLVSRGGRGSFCCGAYGMGVQRHDF